MITINKQTIQILLTICLGIILILITAIIGNLYIEKRMLKEIRDYDECMTCRCRCGFDTNKELKWNIPSREETDEFCKKLGYDWGKIDTLLCSNKEIECFSEKGPEGIFKVNCIKFK